jgi:fucose permease
MNTLLRIAMGSAFVGAVLLMINVSDGISIIGVAIIGFAIAPIFPALVSDTSNRVGAKHAANTIGIQMSIGAGLGGASISALIGIFAAINRESIAISMVVLYGLLFGLFVLSLVMRKSSVEAQPETKPEVIS